MEALEKFLICNAEGTPTHVAHVHPDTCAHLWDDYTYGCAIVGNYQHRSKQATYLKDQGDEHPHIYYAEMVGERELNQNDDAVMRIICDVTPGLYAPHRDDVESEWDEEDEARPDYDPDEDGNKWRNRRESAVDKIMEERAEKFMADNGIVWNTFEGHGRDSCTWLVFSTAKMREASGHKHDKAKDCVDGYVETLRQLNEGEVYGYTVYELTPIEVPEGFEDIVEDSDLTIEHDDVWYKMGDEESCWGFIGYKDHEEAIKDNFLPAGEYNFSNLE